MGRRAERPSEPRIGKRLELTPGKLIGSEPVSSTGVTVPKTRSRLPTPGEQEVMAGASDRFAAWARLEKCYREKLETPSFA
jgi:hypothetical protein